MSILLTLLLTLLTTLTTPCAVEDSNNCYWDASTRGNQQGYSFVTINDHTYTLGEYHHGS
jgi:hypothetical protein